MLPAANERGWPNKKNSAERNPTNVERDARTNGDARGERRPDASAPSNRRPGGEPAASRPGARENPREGAMRPGAGKPGAPAASATGNNAPGAGKPAAYKPNGKPGGKPAAYSPRGNGPRPAHHGPGKPASYKPGYGKKQGYGNSYRPYHARSPRYRPGHAYSYWPGYSYRPAAYVPYRHSRYWYWSEPYHVIVRPFVRYYVPVYAPFVIWMGFPLVVYEEVVYVSGPQTVVVTETTYYEEEEYEEYEEMGEYADDGSASQTYTVWEDGEDESYPWEATQANADEAMARLAAEPGALNDSDIEEVAENEGTIEPEPVAAAGEEEVEEVPDLFMPEVERQVVDIINKMRSEAGLEPLVHEPMLQAAADQHSEEMFRLNYFDHESPVEENRTLPQRLVSAGMKKYGWAGENIAMVAKPAAESLVEMWMKSQGHKENILRADFRFTGIAVYGDGDRYYATQVFSSGK